MSEHDFLYSKTLQNKFREVLDYFEVDHLVYVGLPPGNVFRAPGQMWWYSICKEVNLPYTIIERFEPWANELKEEGHNAVCADVCEYIPPTDNSLLLWSHGPEHITKEEFKKCIPFFEDKYVNFIVAMPYGIWEQTSSVNPYEEHKWHADISDLEELGFDYIGTNGPKDHKGDLFGVYHNG